MSILLRVCNLSVSIGEKPVLYAVSFALRKGEILAVMGPNGSGKSTLVYALMGHPNYTINDQTSNITLNARDITRLSTEERAKAGLFMSLQSPVAIPGVTVMNILRTAYQEKQAKARRGNSPLHNPGLAQRWNAKDLTLAQFTSLVKNHANRLHIDESLLSRGIHDGFSGGEKKKIEMLTALVLKPSVAMFDEIDTGLDVDALKVVAYGIETLAKSGTGVIIITHYQRILKYVRPSRVHVLANGRIVKTGRAQLAREIEEQGYTTFL